MKSFTANWKTSLGGLMTAGMGVLSLFGVKVAGAGTVDPQTALTMIIAGITMAFAKDGNVTGGNVSQ